MSGPDQPFMVTTDGQVCRTGLPPFNDALRDALDSIHSTIVFSAADHGATRREAWIYGIVVGWCDVTSLCGFCEGEPWSDGTQCLIDELAERHGWSSGDTARLRRYRSAVLERMEPSDG